MRCGNKKCGNNNRHNTVAEVRACYGVAQTTPLSSPRLPKIHEPKTVPVLVGSASDIEEQVLMGETFIEELPPKRIPSIADWSRFKAIPAGYYATPSLTGNNDLDFWKVDDGKGRWEGYKFVKRVIGGRDDARIPRDSKKRVKTERIRERVTQAAAFQAILDAGIETSNHLFGIELKYCRECGIHLTDELSRQLGIGPVCRSK